MICKHSCARTPFSWNVSGHTYESSKIGCCHWVMASSHWRRFFKVCKQSTVPLRVDLSNHFVYHLKWKCPSCRRWSLLTITDLEYSFSLRPNLISGMCQASANSEVLIELGATVVLIQTQLAECNTSFWGTSDWTCVNSPSSSKSVQTLRPWTSESISKLVRVVTVLSD